MRILLIEDEEKTARAIVSALSMEGFAASWAETGEEGFFLLNSERFDALILDWMLPGRTGLEVLKTLRTKDVKMPVLLLTARDALDIDQGSGIAPEHQQKIFERFYRIDKARSRTSGGAGLGLSITRWAIERQEGRIELESEAGQGSLFRIVMPDGKPTTT